jgi:hypothetical protein
VLHAVEGRTEDTHHASYLGGQVRVHPDVFPTAPDHYAVRGWQVEQAACGLTVHIIDPTGQLAC